MYFGTNVPHRAENVKRFGLGGRAIASKFGGGDTIRGKKSERPGWKKRTPLI
jgi:hypothetical protein